MVENPSADRLILGSTVRRKHVHGVVFARLMMMSSSHTDITQFTQFADMTVDKNIYIYPVSDAMRTVEQQIHTSHRWAH